MQEKQKERIQRAHPRKFAKLGMWERQNFTTTETILMGHNHLGQVELSLLGFFAVLNSARSIQIVNLASCYCSEKYIYFTCKSA